MVALRSFLIASTFVFVTLCWIFWHTPSANELRQINRGVHYIVEKSEGSIKLVGVEGGFNARRGNIPQHLLNALVASEDHRFYDRTPLYMVAKASQALSLCMINKLTASKRRCVGNSTVTQQLAKLLMPPEKNRTHRRKALELLWALKMELVFTKEEILSMYANRIPLGSGYYGVAMAARGYFSNDVKNLNLFESALLVASVQKPVRNPVRQPKENRARAQLILNLMNKHGFLDEAVKLPNDYKGRQGYRFPPTRFDGYLWYWIEHEIQERMSNSKPGLYKVWSTMDPELQIYSQRRLDEAINNLPKISQGVVVVMKASGQVLAMVGGSGDSLVARGRNRAIKTRGLNCPAAASTMKIVVYSAAIENGLTPNSLIDASPYEHTDTKGRVYRPQNYDRKVHGMVLLSDAFKKSFNTGTVRMLEAFGFPQFRSIAKRYGLSLKGVANELGIALGQNQVCPLDMTVAYATLANNGYRPKGNGVVGIINNTGSLVYQKPNEKKWKMPWSRDLGSRTVKHMSTMLKLSVDKDSTGKRASRNLPALSIAGKTGTIDGFTGAWFIGYAEPKQGFVNAADRLVIGVWMGNDIPTPSQGLYGGTEPARVFNNLLRDISRHTHYFTNGCANSNHKCN